MGDQAWDSIIDGVIEDVFGQTQTISPPTDALRIAQQLQLRLLWDDSQESRGRLQRFGHETAILLRHDPRPERVQWAAAHEIGESLIWQLAQRAGADFEEITPRQRENLANRVASRLLLPACWWQAAIAEIDGNLPALKERFSTASYELIAMRQLDGETPLVVSVWDQGQLVRRRQNLPGASLPLTCLEQELWQEVHNTALPADISGVLGPVRIWPIHEPEWKREIGLWAVNSDGLEALAEEARRLFVSTPSARGVIRSW